MVVPDDLNLPIFAVMLKKDGEVHNYRKYDALGTRSRAGTPRGDQRERSTQQLRELIEKELS